MKNKDELIRDSPVINGYRVYVRFTDFGVWEVSRVFYTVQAVLDFAHAVKRRWSCVDTVGVWWNGPHGVRIGFDDVFEWGYSYA